jgi:hypothetical protein
VWKNGGERTGLTLLLGRGGIFFGVSSFGFVTMLLGSDSPYTVFSFWSVLAVVSL